MPLSLGLGSALQRKSCQQGEKADIRPQDPRGGAEAGRSKEPAAYAAASPPVVTAQCPDQAMKTVKSAGVPSAVLKTGSRQGPAAEQRGSFSIPWEPGWDGAGGRRDTCPCIAEALCCSLETITALLTGYTPIQNKKCLKIACVHKQTNGNRGTEKNEGD